jgi:hypothetical protein
MVTNPIRVADLIVLSCLPLPPDQLLPSEPAALRGARL